jgi:3-hydroxyacyl-[acyl-carrier-protein] dehydratase
VDSTGGRIDFDEIRELLPQKFPFLMIDRVVAIEKGKKVVAFKNITGNELFFPGHFPAMAVMPGALIIESMAQAAIILFRKSDDTEAATVDREDRLFFFGAAKARFFRPVVPGDQLYLEVTITKAISSAGIVEAIATVDGQVVSKADLTFGVKRLEDFRRDLGRTPRRSDG